MNLEEKAACRKHVLAVRDAIPEKLREHKSAEICRQLFRMVQQACECQACRRQIHEQKLRKKVDECSVADELTHITQTCFQQSRVSAIAKAPYKQPFTIAVYSAMRSEVDLEQFIVYAYEQGWRVAFPVMIAEESKLCMRFFCIPPSRYKNAHEAFLSRPLLKMTQQHMEELGYSEVPAQAFDFVVCPVVAFDSYNMRIGYGGGNYDAFLSKLLAQTTVVGVAYAEQQVARVPSEPHDVALPQLITA